MSHDVCNAIIQNDFYKKRHSLKEVLKLQKIT